MNRTPRPLRSFHLTVFSIWQVLLVPLIILAMMIAISVIIALIISIQVGLPLPAEATEGMRYNMGAIFAIPGFLITVGALTHNRQFATALAFGSTRRDFWLGSSLGFLAVAAVTGIGSVLLLLVEKATGHWFIGARAMDVAPLGDGDPWQTFLTITSISLCSLFLGAAFGTLFRASGPRAVMIAALGLLVFASAATALVVWQWDSWSPTLIDLGAWLIPIGMTALGLVAAVGSYLTNARSGIAA